MGSQITYATTLKYDECHSKYDASVKPCVNYPVVTSPVPSLLSALWHQRPPGLSRGHTQTGKTAEGGK